MSIIIYLSDPLPLFACFCGELEMTPVFTGEARKERSLRFFVSSRSLAVDVWIPVSTGMTKEGWDNVRAGFTPLPRAWGFCLQSRSHHHGFQPQTIWGHRS